MNISHDLMWLLVGLGLIVVEMMTGTFYLLLLGIAAFIGAIVAYVGVPFWGQAIVVAAAAAAGSIVLRRKRAGGRSRSAENQMDVGQSVVLEEWTSEPQRLARVRYRGASWDAEVRKGDAAAPGSVLYIAAVEGSHLKVTASRPS